VSYTIGWTQGDTSGTWSGGRLRWSSAPGAQATIPFTGTSISWIGGRTPQTGIARVFLDGVFVAEVDTYSKSQEVRVPMFAAAGLADASHTFHDRSDRRQKRVRGGCPHRRGCVRRAGHGDLALAGNGSSVTYSAGWVQDNPIVTLIPGVTTGWTQGASLRGWSAGAARLSTTPGAQCDLHLHRDGDQLDRRSRNPERDSLAFPWMASWSPWSICTRQGTIQAEVFAATGLAATSHTLTIEGTGSAKRVLAECPDRGWMRSM